MTAGGFIVDPDDAVKPTGIQVKLVGFSELNLSSDNLWFSRMRLPSSIKKEYHFGSFVGSVRELTIVQYDLQRQ
jgi:hypothetical protein